MIEFSVRQGGRGGGKTYAMMSEIHDLIVAGRVGEVVIVFPARNWVHWWTREWESRFPYVPMPKYTTVSNTMNMRGYRFSKLFVEDLDKIDDGIYNEKIRDLLVGLVSPLGDEEVIFNSSLIPVNQRTHSEVFRSADVLNKRYKSWSEIKGSKK